MSEIKLGSRSYKLIGTQNREEFGDTSWQPHTADEIPLGTVVSKPKGFLWAHGSACVSLATTSNEGLRYTGDWFVFRLDSSHINTDRYFVSSSPDGVGTVIMQHKAQNPYHVVNLNSPITEGLPERKRRQLKKLLKDCDKGESAR